MDFNGGNMDDFHAFESTSGDSKGYSGCLFSDFFKVAVILSVIFFFFSMCTG